MPKENNPVPDKQDAEATDPERPVDPQELLRIDWKKREAECQRMIQIALETTRCSLDVKMILSERGATPQVNIVAND